LLGVAVLLVLGSECALAQDAAEQAKAINLAITRGVDYLRGIQAPDGTWPRQQEVGATSLAGLTLLECGIPANDPAVQKAAEVTRKACLTFRTVYPITTAIFFLDKLGDPQDVPLIEALGVQLLAGQDRKLGAWGYPCPPLPPAQAARLAEVIKNRKPEAPKEAAVTLPRRVTDLPKDIRDWLRQIYSTPPVDALADHSNTQLAIMALWVSRRYGVPVDLALRATEIRFRRCQYPSGGWSYQFPIRADGMPSAQELAASELYKPTASMTCTGLMALAFSHGTLDNTKADPKKTLGADLQVRQGLLALGTFIGNPMGDVRKGAILEKPGHMYYFLWTLERTAVIYGLKTIGNKDWYQWGAEVLLANQQANGSWVGDYAAGGPDTCFALLFLKRANAAEDLSKRLQGQGKDPGEASPKLQEMINLQFHPSDLKKRKKTEPQPPPGKQGALRFPDRGPVRSATATASAEATRTVPRDPIVWTRRTPADPCGCC